MSGLPQNEESQKLQVKCQEMTEAVQQCISKLKATGAHVSSEEVASTNNDDIITNSDPQSEILESAEVGKYQLMKEKILNIKLKPAYLCIHKLSNRQDVGFPCCNSSKTRVLILFC